MKENRFQQLVKKQLESQGAFIINYHGHLMQRSGLPDLQILHRKFNGFLELKVGKNKCSVLQRIVAAKIILRRTPCYVLRCVEHDINGYGKLFKNKRIVYQLENFEGKVIKSFCELKDLLSHLISLNSYKKYLE